MIGSFAGNAFKIRSVALSSARLLPCGAFLRPRGCGCGSVVRALFVFLYLRVCGSYRAV